MSTEITSEVSWMEPFFRFFRSASVKLIVIAVLVLVLLIPLAMVEGLIEERRASRVFAESAVQDMWGGGQDLVGPILTVPYRYRTRDSKGNVETHIGASSFLPAELHVSGDVKPEVRYRGIFPVPLYTASLKLGGEFRQPDFSEWKIANEDVLWEDAIVSVGITGLPGIEKAVSLSWNQGAAPFKPGSGRTTALVTGIHARVGGLKEALPNRTHTFEFALDLNGSRHFTFAPVGEETTAALKSSWSSPSFVGSFLPDTRRVDESGFEANWRVIYLARPYPQQWKDGEVVAQTLAQSNAGVQLFFPVDAYVNATRAAKFGVLFLFLTFGAYFLFEVTNRLRIHPIQYLLIGFALCLFYVLLLSFSEHLRFDVSYALSTAGTIGLITAYSASVLGAGRSVVGMTTLLVGLYAYLYVLLQLEDYALLLGALGLFVVLAAVMFWTRRLDWYGLHK